MQVTRDARKCTRYICGNPLKHLKKGIHRRNRRKARQQIQKGEYDNSNEKKVTGWDVC